jgi:predicted nucleic acid-binding protein
MRLFLDANVIFTAAYTPDGRSAALFELARRRHCSLVSSAFAIEEAVRDLRTKRPASMEQVEQLLVVLVIQAEPTNPDVAWAVHQGLPIKEAPILAAAAAARVALLVTGDRTHFGHLFGRRLRSVTIVPPADALGRVLGNPLARG